jgi:HEAT repeat protein
MRAVCWGEKAKAFSSCNLDGLMDTEIPTSVKELCEMLVDGSHQLHGDIIRSLQDRKDPYAIPFLRRAVLLKSNLEYLSYDDYGSYYKKCFWALCAIGTPEAFAVIEDFANSTDNVIREQARYRLSRIRGDKP